MEKFPQQNKPTENKSFTERLKRGARAAVFGAGLAMSPGIGEAAEPVSTRIEKQETFNAEKEVKAFLEEIKEMDMGIDDARGRSAIRTKIEEKLTTFVLALKQESSHFSHNGTVSIQGEVTLQDRVNVYRMLSEAMDKEYKNSDDPELRILKEMVQQQKPPAVNESLDVPQEMKKKYGDW